MDTLDTTPIARMATKVAHVEIIPDNTDTFFCTARGESMTPLVHAGDLMIVDKSQTPKHGDLIVVDMPGGYLARKLFVRGGFYCLLPENKDFSPVLFEMGNCPEIFGVVTHILKRVGAAR
jgi:DNA polymerase V